MAKYIGILTSGGDSPGLNAAIRGVGKAALDDYDMQVIGFHDGFRGLMENRTTINNRKKLSGIITLGGTLLGTSREKPHKMNVGGKKMDMTGVIAENYHKHHLDALICLGGGGTQKNAYKLVEKGLNIVTLPKTIDNDVAGTDTTFGFDTALGIAVDAIDRLHSTAHSHHRIIVVEIMGHRTGWLALGVGVSGGADVILIPEIPYDIEVVAESILERSRKGKNFSIVAVAEGAISREGMNKIIKVKKEIAGSDNSKDIKKLRTKLKEIDKQFTGKTIDIAQELEKMTGLESRLTILGHLQRGGTPSPADRLLATKLGTACVDYIQNNRYGIMVASKGEGTEAVPLEKVIGIRKTVPTDHSWIKSARRVGTCLGTGEEIKQ